MARYILVNIDTQAVLGQKLNERSIRPFVSIAEAYEMLARMEAKAGMDVVALRRKYGQAFTMRGGVAKSILFEGKEAIDRELDRIGPVVLDGGYIPEIDHSIPAGVRFEHYCYYIEEKKKRFGIR